MLKSEFEKLGDENLYYYESTGMFHYYVNCAGNRIFDDREFEKGKAEGKYKEVFIDLDDFMPSNDEIYL